MTSISVTDKSIMHKIKIYQSGGLLVSEPNNELKHSLCPITEYTDQKNNKKRGKIKGFSNRSAMRLKQNLICFDYSSAFEMALTSPPYAPRSPETVLKQIGKHISRFGDIALVWRKEVTKIGTIHYHLIVWSHNHSYAYKRLCEYWTNVLFPRDFDYSSIVDDIIDGINGHNIDKVCDDCLKVQIINAYEKGLPVNQGQVDILEHKTLCDWCRARVLQVNEHKSRNFRAIEGVGFIKYILDHTSKHKEYQAHTVGRAWGILNKASIPRSIPDDFEMSGSQFDVFLRLLGKMSRYRLPKACVFGSYLTHRRKYNSSRIWGRSAQFIDPLQVRRLVSFVLENYC